MSSILRRTCFFDPSGGEIRMFDWNLVVTTLGTMVEPRNLLGVRPSGADHDHKDECAKIDDLRTVDWKQKYTVLGAGEVLHGGEQRPQNFDYNY